MKSQRLTSGRQPGEILRQHESCRDQQCHAHTELDEAPRGARHHARTQPGADHCRDDHGDERREVYHDDRHKDERFHHGGQGVADVQGPRDVLVRHAMLHLEDGGRGREASDAQSIEEVGAETDQDIRRARLRAPARRPLEGKPAPQVAEARGQERRQERVAAVEVQRLDSRVRQLKRRRSNGVTSWTGSRPQTSAAIRSAVTGARVNPRCWWPMA